jgi:hypothetical protein
METNKKRCPQCGGKGEYVTFNPTYQEKPMSTRCEMCDGLCFIEATSSARKTKENLCRVCQKPVGNNIFTYCDEHWPEEEKLEKYASPAPTEKTAEEIMIENCLPNGGLLKLGEGQRILSAMKAFASAAVAAERKRSEKLIKALEVIQHYTSDMKLNMPDADYYQIATAALKEYGA